MGIQFEWDPNKAAANSQKHGVSFDEAATVFADPLARIFDDDAHSIGELRELIIGHSIKNRLLFVAFTERKENVIRIITAREADQVERRRYEEEADC
jgi:uncharacterized protein